MKTAKLKTKDVFDRIKQLECDIINGKLDINELVSKSKEYKDLEFGEFGFYVTVNGESLVIIACVGYMASLKDKSSGQYEYFNDKGDIIKLAYQNPKKFETIKKVERFIYKIRPIYESGIKKGYYSDFEIKKSFYETSIKLKDIKM